MTFFSSSIRFLISLTNYYSYHQWTKKLVDSIVRTQAVALSDGWI